jgi:hypothetical protein
MENIHVAIITVLGLISLFFLLKILTLEGPTK